MSQELLVALIAAGAAIIASVGAQIIGAVVSARQEQRRFEWEKERYKAEIDAAEASRFEDVKRDTFVEYIDSAVRVCAYLMLLQSEPVWWKRRRQFQALTAANDRFELATVKVRLLAPEVYATTYAVGEEIKSSSTAYVERRRQDMKPSELYALLRKTRRDMQKSLGIAAEPLSEVSPPSTTLVR